MNLLRPKLGCEAYVLMRKPKSKKARPPEDRKYNAVAGDQNAAAEQPIEHRIW